MDTGFSADFFNPMTSGVRTGRFSTARHANATNCIATERCLLYRTHTQTCSGEEENLLRCDKRNDDED